MATLDFEKLENLLKAGQTDEAQALLTEFFKTELTPEEKGAAYVGLFSLYIDLQNEISEDYLALLEQTLKAQQSLGSAEVDLDEAGELTELRKKFQE